MQKYSLFVLERTKISFFAKKNPQLFYNWGLEMYCLKIYYLTKTHVPLAIKVSAFLNFIVSVLPVATS